MKLRYDLIRDAVLDFANYIDGINGNRRTRVQLYTFDDILRLNQSLTTNMALVRANLPTAPQTSGETVGGTRWWTYANTIPGLIGAGGDGTTQAKAVKLVMMLTDGAQDPNRTWTWNTPLRDYVREMDWTACNTMRTNKVKVGVVHVPYLDMPWTGVTWPPSVSRACSAGPAIDWPTRPTPCSSAPAISITWAPRPTA